jgi:hypothetical protein
MHIASVDDGFVHYLDLGHDKAGSNIFYGKLAQHQGCGGSAYINAYAENFFSLAQMLHLLYLQLYTQKALLACSKTAHGKASLPEERLPCLSKVISLQIHGLI